MKPAFFQLILCAISGSALASATSTRNGTATTANSTSTGSLARTSPGTLAGSAFSTTCMNIGFSSTTILASCPDANGIFHSSSINTNNCIGNNDGNLVPGNKYASTCSAITFTPTANGVILNAACKNEKKQEVQASVNLDTIISNNGGTLSCI
ncbi:Cyanovirin-N [Mycena epipterygia]|nr:Cyanovirin-N [Mycena epipterygia]